MKQKNFSLLSSGAVSLAATRNLAGIQIDDEKYVGIQLVFTGTPAGNFKLQISNDPQNIAGTVPTNWSDVADSSQTISASGDLFFEYPVNCAAWVRVVWTATGTGTTPLLTVARVVLKG